MRSYRGLHTDLEAVYSVSEIVVGLGVPRPPNLGGSESRLCSKSLGGALPVRHRMNLERVTLMELSKAYHPWYILLWASTS